MNYRIQLNGEEIKLDRVIPAHLASKVLLLLNEEPTSRTLHSEKPDLPEDKEQTVSDCHPLNGDLFKEFCTQNNVYRSCEVVVAYGIYYTRIFKKETFTRELYGPCYKALKGKEDRAIKRSFEWAIENNWIAKEGNNAYKVTPAGNHALKEKFPPSVRGATRGKRHR